MTNGSGQSGRGRNQNRGNRQRTQQQWFEGREPTLKGYVYDFTGERMPDQFIKTTKEIKNYVGRTYTKYTADLAQAVEDLVIQDPVAPADPDLANQLAVESMEDGTQGASREGAALRKLLSRPVQRRVGTVHRGTRRMTEVARRLSSSPQ
jgi:hypothetical protein